MAKISRTTDKLDQLIEGFAGMRSDVKHLLREVTEIHVTIKEQNGRITKLEHWKSKIIGAVAIGVPAASVGINWLMAKLGINNK